jgi:hypothetical protein
MPEREAQLLKYKSHLCEEEGKLQEALDIMAEGARLCELNNINDRCEGHLSRLYAKMGDFALSLDLLEKFCKRMYDSGRTFYPNIFVKNVHDELQKCGKTLLECAAEKDCPHVLWALKLSGVELTKELKEKSRAKRDVRENVTCFQCKTPLKKMYCCSGCNNALYCGPSCQKKHWAVHRSGCGKVPPKQGEKTPKQGEKTPKQVEKTK